MKLINLYETNYNDKNVESISIKLSKEELTLIRSGLNSKYEFYKNLEEETEHKTKMVNSYKSLFEKFNNLYCLSNGNIREVEL